MISKIKRPSVCLLNYRQQDANGQAQIDCELKSVMDDHQQVNALDKLLGRNLVIKAFVKKKLILLLLLLAI